MPAGSILVADDDTAIRTVLNQALSRAGYEVRLTGNAATLWRWVSQGEGDLVITDAVMPDEEPHHEPDESDSDPALILELPAPPLLPGVGRSAADATGTGATLMEQNARLRAAHTPLLRDLAPRTGLPHAPVHAQQNRRPRQPPDLALPRDRVPSGRGLGGRPPRAAR